MVEGREKKSRRNACEPVEKFLVVNGDLDAASSGPFIPPKARQPHQSFPNIPSSQSYHSFKSLHLSLHPRRSIRKTYTLLHLTTTSSATPVLWMMGILELGDKLTLYSDWPLRACLKSVTAITASTLFYTCALSAQVLLSNPDFSLPSRTPNRPHKVAIIGGGIAGAVAAHQLRTKHPDPSQLVITVFEAYSHIGGLLNSTLVHNEPHTPNSHVVVETGSTHFSTTDFCMQAMIDQVGLRDHVVQDPQSDGKARKVGVWDGANIIVRRRRDLIPRTLLEHLRDVFEYTPLIKPFWDFTRETLEKYRKLWPMEYDASHGMSKGYVDVGLDTHVHYNAYSYLVKVAPLGYLMRILEPTVRRAVGRNIDRVNILSAVVAMDPEPTYRLTGWRGMGELPHRLLLLSSSAIKLNERVTKIRKANGTFTVSTVTGDFDEEFDAVIVATNLQKAELEFDIPDMTRTPPMQNFTETHITHFTATTADLTIPPDFPEIVYTTSKLDDQHEYLGILSIERSKIPNGEVLYRITSAEPIPDAVISMLLGSQPHTPPREAGATWVHRKRWEKAWPEEIALVWDADVESAWMAEGLYYTGIAEEVVARMEMVCRFANAVAGTVGRGLGETIGSR
ncbi:hypothetical protein M011DRAFT_525149 [Sporormia fimetaria CBS 119925]|uniref:Amine oxidase domain-containing protein n=1 Tax=Sporormia fimetaria CBS 119925 TaxID=1340428 RepID=A0A6A6VFA4_9PLEO|nr:hypothetical protein M011DRAFT_525149 [Sporormia fimetaria CBS 119925]